MNDVCEIALSFKCPKKFDDLSGCGTTRFCQQCSKSVTNLSGLSKTDATLFLNQAPTKVCIRYQTTSTGEILFKSNAALRLAKRMIHRALVLIAFLIPSSNVFANDALQPNESSSIPTSCNNDDDDFLGEIAPFEINIDPINKRAVKGLKFNTRKNFQNNKAAKNSKHA